MSALDLALVVLRLLIGVWLLWSVPRLGRVGGAADTTTLAGVTVVVPARNEAASLPHLLDALPEGVEVVVIDDESTDATAAEAVLRGARVLGSEPRPAGWTGKAWACAQGAAATRGDVLVFVDADVRIGARGLTAVVERVRDGGGLVSVQPHHEPGTPVEHLAALFNVVAIAGTDTASPLGRRRGVRGAFGPVLATTRADYDAVGGHEVARASVVDDVALASAYRRSGRAVRVFGGGDLVGFRMYPDGFGQIVEGFARTMATGARSVRWLTTLLVVAWSTLHVQAAVAPFRAVVTGSGLAAALALYAVVAVQLWWMARKVGRFHRWVAATFPVSVALFLAVFLRSAVSTLRGSVTWKGRRVPTR